MTYNPELETQLRVWSGGDEVLFPEGSAFVVSASLDFIDGALRTRRTVNGALRVQSNPAFRKYRLTLSCSAQFLPVLMGLDPTEPVEVWSPLVVRERGVTPSRPAVPGSVAVEAGYVEYRPILTGYFTELPSQSGEEWQSADTWSFSVEEA